MELLNLERITYVPSRRIALSILLFVGTLFVVQSYRSTRERLRSNAQLGEQLVSLSKVLENQAEGAGQRQDIVVMTRNPWEVYHTTKVKCIQIPNDSLAVVDEVARRYRANFLLLPAPREALAGIDDGTTHDDRFQFVAAIRGPGGIPPLKLFRINLH